MKQRFSSEIINPYGEILLKLANQRGSANPANPPFMFKNLVEVVLMVRCPECGSAWVWRDGLRYLPDGSVVQLDMPGLWTSVLLRRWELTIAGRLEISSQTPFLIKKFGGR